MKAKFRIIFSLISLILAGCGGKNTPAHEHSYKKGEWLWSEKATGGYDVTAVFECSTCDENQEGHEVTIAVNEQDITSRVIEEATCSKQGKIEYTASVTFLSNSYSDVREFASKINDNAHHFIEVINEEYLAKEATCLEDATYYKSCEYCHEKSEETFVAIGTKLDHNLENHPAVSSTCLEHGNIEYWQCTMCEKYFSDEHAQHEISEEEIILPVSGEHDLTFHAGVDSTCSVNGHIEYYQCEVCEKYFSDEDGQHELSEEELILPLSDDHDLEFHEKVESTCTLNGNIEYYQCKDCNKYFVKNEQGKYVEITQEETISPLAHKMTLHEGHEATCYEAGTLDYYTCEHESDEIWYKDEEGTEVFENHNDIIIPQLEHSFDDSLECTHCHDSLKDVYEMEDTTALDAIAPVTLSDIGTTSGVTVTSDHVWGTYDYDTNKGIDLWFEMEYDVVSGQFLYFYLFNGGNEDGIVFRIETTRAEDDGYIHCCIYTVNEYTGATTVVRTADTDGTKFWFPKETGFHSRATATEKNLVHVTAYCVNEETNLYRCALTIGAESAIQQYPRTNPEDHTNTPMTFDIELGASYFSDLTNNNKAHKRVRFSSSRSGDNTHPSNVTISDYTSTASSLVYKDADGNVVGKFTNPTSSQVKFPALKAENKKFVGWFDANGNKMSDGDSISGKVVVTPRFVDETGNDMFTLSNYGFDTAGKWLEVSDNPEVAGSTEKTSPNGVSTTGTSYDVYFIYQLESAESGDRYIIFGAPYDTTDATTRFNIRLNETPGENALKGYAYGAGTIGGAGSSTSFTFGSNTRNNKFKPLLIHFNISLTGTNTVSVTVDFTDLATGTNYALETKTTTFNTDFDLSETFVLRNKFGIVASDCTGRLTDAF